MPLGHPVDQEIAWSLDGSQFYFGSVGSTMTQQNQTTMTNLNSWSAGYTFTVATSYDGCLLWVFPEARDITAFRIGKTGNTSGASSVVQTSSNTTNGEDGTWTTRYINTDINGWLNLTTVQLRTPLVVSWSAVKAIRMYDYYQTSTGPRTWGYAHFWGNFSRPGLAFWDVSADNIMNGQNLDFGDVTQGSVYTRQFRIKNNSAQTANNVLVSAQAGARGQILNGLEFDGGSGYGADYTIPTIAPGAISPVITVRRTVSPTAPLDIGAGRVMAVPQSWT